MCGIVGVLNLDDGHQPVEMDVLRQMLGMIRHRGPDDFGIYRDDQVGLGNARLSIIDLAGGQQPIGTGDGALWIVYNGEVYNFPELRRQLEARGHHFSTNTDTEVVLRLYQDLGPDCLQHLNGQFAFAIWNARERSLFLARDRMGIRPLFYTLTDRRLIFGSEIKALLAHPAVRAEIDPSMLSEILSYWSTLSPGTLFCQIKDLPPGHFLLARPGHLSIQPYWELDLASHPDASRPEADYLDEFESLLIDATRIRLRADVPVGAYLSGGLDSAVTATIIRQLDSAPLDTFSIAFQDPAFDESPSQQEMVAFLGTSHQVTNCSHADIGSVFPDVIWHTETPILRTSPAPMFLLSGLVHSHGLKVVLTGEGADEILAGYNIFKEMMVRRFWARIPDSEIRPLLLTRLYPYIKALSSASRAYLIAFFKRGLTDTDSPFYSHAIRWANGARIHRFLASNDRGGMAGTAPLPGMISLPEAFSEWSHLGQAQFLEMSIFLAQYLLSSQGDRMLAAHSVEGRFPFLDYRLVSFCNRLPPQLKLRGLTEKWLLKQLGRKMVPVNIWRRAKQPYRAPIQRSFFHPAAPDYVRELLSEDAIRTAGLFNPAAVTRLVRKAQQGTQLGEVDEMALVAILSTQLVYHLFVNSFQVTQLQDDEPVKIVDQVEKSWTKETFTTNY